MLDGYFFTGCDIDRCPIDQVPLISGNLLDENCGYLWVWDFGGKPPKSSEILGLSVGCVRLCARPTPWEKNGVTKLHWKEMWEKTAQQGRRPGPGQGHGDMRPMGGDAADPNGETGGCLKELSEKGLEEFGRFLKSHEIFWRESLGGQSRCQIAMKVFQICFRILKTWADDWGY